MVSIFIKNCIEYISEKKMKTRRMSEVAIGEHD